MTDALIEEAGDRSVDLLARALTDGGFVASAAFEHYAVVWTRDAAVSSLGALASGSGDLTAGAVESMRTMQASASPLGHIAAVIRSRDGDWDWGEGGVVDATAWYVILAGAVLGATGDKGLVADQWQTISRAMSWLRHQDVTGSGLLSAAPATDWMDASLVRMGRTLSLNVLYHWAARSASRVAMALGKFPPVDPDDIAWRVNALFWPSEDEGPETLLTGHAGPLEHFPHPATVAAHQSAARADRGHYVSHVVHSHYDESCDVPANLIAVVTGLAGEHSMTILDHLDAEEVTRPYPSRVLADPVDTTDPSMMHLAGVETHLDERWHNPPYHYHNGAVWPYVGGLHITALALVGRSGEARHTLGHLAEANEAGDWGFHEWLHGETGEPHGARDQTWNAGAYLLAREALHDPGSVRALLG